MACWRATNKTIFALVSLWFSKATLANFTFRQTPLATVRLFCSSTTKEPSLEKVSSKTFREEATKRKPLPEFIIKDWNELTLKQKMQRIFFRRYARSQAAFNLYDLCEAQSSRPEFSKILGVQSDFDGWFGIRLLHVWLVMVRLRMEGYEGAKLQQIVFDQFWEITELRVSKLLEEGGMSKGAVSFTIMRHMKALAGSYYATVLSYDEALLDGDPPLATALFCNLFKEDPNISFGQIEAMVYYVRSQVVNMEKIPSKDVQLGYHCLAVHV